MACGHGEFVGSLERELESKYSRRSLTIGTLAQALGLSERQFQRRVRQATGKSPASYLREYRLVRARQLIGDGRSIGDIAHAVGFSSHAYFAHCFKAHFGQTPSEYMTARNVSRPKWRGS